MHVVPWDNDMLVHAAVEVDSFFFGKAAARAVGLLFPSP
jgi:hypothetical protein